MKLAIFIYSLSGGGAERQTSYILSYCRANNIETHLLLMNTTIKYQIPEDIKVHYLEKSEVTESGIIKAMKIPFLAYKYSRLLKKLKITHSISLLVRPNFINLIASRFTPYNFKVITNELAYPSLQYSYKGFQSHFNKILIKALYKKSDLIITNSFGNAHDLTDNFKVPSSKIKTVYNPIDLKKIQHIKTNTSLFDRSHFNIITVGRLERGKNHEMLIRAIHKSKNPIVRLYIFGVGDLKKELELLINKLAVSKEVKLMGFDPNPYQYLKAADLFIFGSNHEGFPNVLLEAMACGLPILSTNCQSGPSEIMELEDVKNDLMITDYGVLVPIKNVELMAKGIKYFIDNPDYSENCRINGQIRIKDFDKDDVLKKYIDLISAIH